MKYLLDSVISVLLLGLVGWSIGIARAALRRYPHDR